MMVACSNLFAQSVTKTIGGVGANYTTLKAAFDAINSGAIKGAISLQITGSTTETATAMLNSSGTGLASYSSVKIYPTVSGITVSGNISNPLIDFNGANNVTLDGRVNMSGSNKDLTISNLSTSGSSNTSTLRLINSAANNTFEYLILKGGATGIYSGVVLFSNSSSGNGNSNNVITQCNITSISAGSRPYYGIYSYGTSGRENKNNTVSFCNVFDFFSPTLSASYGIDIDVNSTDWIITDNSFYETTNFSPSNSNSYFIIKTNNPSGNNFVITNNSIGGSAPNCGGNPWVMSANLPYRFYGIHIDAGTTTPTSIQNNTIKNFNILSGSDIPFMGIDINNGSANVGTLGGNVIGETTGTGSISISAPVATATATISNGSITNITVINGGSNYTTAPTVHFNEMEDDGVVATAHISNGIVTSVDVSNGGSGFTTAPRVRFNGSYGFSTSYGIYVTTTGTVNVSNNNIGSITCTGNTNYSHCFIGINKQPVVGNTTINNNLVGSLTTSNSIQAPTSSTTATAQNVYGIYSIGIGTTTITNNTIANMYNAFAYQYATNGQIAGISCNNGTFIIQNNIIRNLSTTSQSNDPNGNAAVIGISQRSTIGGQTITGNTISSLICTYTGTRPTSIIGINYSGGTTGTNIISGNFIHSFSMASTAGINTPAIFAGIRVYSGSSTISNNIINLGSGLSSGQNICGIYENGSEGNNNNIIFNTVYISGSVSSGSTAFTYAFCNNSNANTRIIKNNIFFNARSGGSVGKHMAIYLTGMSNVTINGNDYFVSGTNSKLGKISTLDKTDFNTWKSATGQDLNSMNTNPLFTLAGGTTAFNYYIGTNLVGLSGTGITTDYDGVSRGSTPKMGALEANNFIWQGSVSTDFGNPSNWVFGVVPPNGADFSFADNANNHCALDQNRSFEDITSSQSSFRLITNGKQLSISGNLNLSNGAQIDASSTSSVINFIGSAAQNIPSGVFYNNIVDGITINNSNNVSINDNLSIQSNLTLTNGSLQIGAHTLTLNGSINTTNGGLTGGSTSNIIIGGSAAIANLPTVSVNNLTLNRANGLNITGVVNVSGTLNLINGTLYIGANTLQISGNAPTRTNGIIDGSNTNGTLIFNNGSAISLPANLFSVLNHVTISGSGGITCNHSFTINGVLNLSATNPSSTKGLLDLGGNTLTMGGNATTLGTGDVTGIVKRTSFIANTVYSFGNQYTTLTLSDGGVMSTDISVKISMGNAPSWKNTAVKRVYDIIHTGGSGTTVTLSLHYLDSEIQSNTESNLVIWDNHSVVPEEHGKANQNTTNNWVAISNRNITYFGTAFDTHVWGISNRESATFVWQGTPSTDWNDVNNWSGGIIPSDTSNVFIPDAATTAHSPLLPTTATVKTITIESGGVLNGGSGTTLNIAGSTGAWLNLGTFNPGTSTVIFTNANATMADPTNFYNLTIASGASLTTGLDNYMRISGTLNNLGTLKAAMLSNTIEFNGADQTIINPNGTTPGYYHLILSGTGTKYLPASSLSVIGDMTISPNITVTSANNLSINGNLTIDTNATFNAGTYTHTLNGNFTNNGTVSAPTGSTFSFTGSSAQYLMGTNTSSFYNLSINNSHGVNLATDENVNGTLQLISGSFIVNAKQLGINGSVTRTSGNLQVDQNSSLSFGGSTALALPSNVFSPIPSINNLTINRSGGVSLGNQNITINGELNLQNGTLNVGGNNIIIAGNSIIKTTGNINVGNANATITFSNQRSITLPSNLFSGSITNLTIDGIGGIVSPSDITLNGVLNLESNNPSSTKGILDLWDGSSTKTLSMGATATTLGNGDVTGIVKRTSLSSNVSYTFGNPSTTFTIASGGTPPTDVSIKISMGTAPAWKTYAVQRIYDIIRTGGSGTTATIRLHYLESELQANSENNLVIWDYHASVPKIDEHGKTLQSGSEDWVELSNRNITYFGTAFDTHPWFLSNKESADFTWQGTPSTDWTDANNWSGGIVPISTSDVVIPDASTTLHSPIISTTESIKSLTIEGAGLLTLANTGKLTVSNVLYNKSDEKGLVISSNSSGTGSLIHNSNNVKATIETYISGTSNLLSKRYHLVSVPINSSTYLSGIWLDSYLFTYNENANSWHYWDAPTGNSLDTKLGAMVFYPNWDTTTSKTYTITGQLNNGSYTPTVSYSGTNFGYNLVPNPYPSAIDWQAASGWTKTNMSGVIWGFNSATGSYGTWNGSTGTNGVTNIIPVGQAYFVHATSSGAVLNMNNSVRIHNTNTPFLKSDLSAEQNTLHLKATGNLGKDEMVVQFADNSSTLSTDDLDAIKFNASLYVPQLSSYTSDDANHLSINALPMNAGVTVIPLYFELKSNESITFNAEGMNSFTGGTSFKLEDQKLHTFTDLSTNSTYTFSHDTLDSPSRFRLHIGNVVGLNNLSQAEKGNAYIFENNIFIHFPCKGNKYAANLYNVEGQILKSFNLVDSGTETLSIGNISKGVYLLNCISAERYETFKIILK